MREIIMAEHAGFCFGVKRAVDAIIDALNDAEDRSEVWTIGLPIHNPQEVDRLKKTGLNVAEDESEIPPGARVLIRAHGEPRCVMESLRAKGAAVTDTTCPFVSRAQKLAESLSREGYSIVLLGDKSHPEIISIMGHADGKVYVAADEAEAAALPRLGRAALISQTTQQEERLARAAAALVPKTEELRVCNTICRATVDRQNAVRSLAGKVDGLVLIGGRTSANTAKLRDIASECGMDVLWVEDSEEIKEARSWFEGRNRIGIAAGASTPEWLINKIKSGIADI